MRPLLRLRCERLPRTSWRFMWRAGSINKPVHLPDVHFNVTNRDKQDNVTKWTENRHVSKKTQNLIMTAVQYTIRDFSNGKIVIENDDFGVMKDLLVLVTGENHWVAETKYYWIGDNGEIWSNPSSDYLPPLTIILASKIACQRHL